jgi:Protein of unknown function (DUF2778)
MTTDTLNQRLEKIGDRALMLNSPNTDPITNTSRNLSLGIDTANDPNQNSSKNSQVPTSIAIGIPPSKPPRVKTTVKGVYDMGTGTLTMTKYEDGKPTQSVTVEPGGSGSKNRGAFSGRGKGMNESEYYKDTDIGPMPLGTYDIHNNSQQGTRQGGPRENYKKKYGVRGGWFRLEFHDNDRNDDHATIRASGRGGGFKIAERKNIRLHIGNDSAGCLTIDPANKRKWLQIEDMLGLDNPTNDVLGTIEVIDSRPGSGNGSADSAMKKTDVLNASNQPKKTVEHTL